MQSYDVNLQLAESRRLFNKAVEKAAVAYRRGDLESTAAWAKIAAHFAFVRHPGFYTSNTLESLLLKVAEKLEKPSENEGNNPWLKLKPKDYGKMRFLHVVTESYDAGGHSPFISRWIKNTTQNSIHSLIATAHKGPVPQYLNSAVIESGGWSGSLFALSENLLEQARFLRKIARNWADVIVLFVHPFDPVPNLAFGVEGGPPVILCNHADHAFWLGGSIADVIVDYHVSAGQLSAKRRGTFNSGILPIPLSKTNIKNSPRNPQCRKELGLNKDELMLLTVARSEKFLPFGNCDFLGVMTNILKKYPNTKLFAIGPKNQGEWEKASAEVDGRIKAMGMISRSNLETFYKAADLYVNSFPCGSQTALLEAGIHNLPIVGLHLKELPHFSGEDDEAFKKLSIHESSICEFTERLELMINNGSSYRRKALLVKENIEHVHCSPGWNAYLDAVLQSLPSQHKVQKPQLIRAQTDFGDAYLSYLGSEMLFNELPEYSFCRLIRVYGGSLLKADTVKAQAECFITSLPKVNSIQRAKEVLCNFRDFAGSTFN